MDRRATTYATAAGLAASGAYALWRRRRRYDFRGKRVLITGGSRGLGLVLARGLLQRGAEVAVAARDSEELRRAARDLGRYASPGSGVWTVACDVRDPSDVEHMMRELEARVGTIDVLINNAGVIQVGPVEAMTFNDYEEAMQVHFFGPLRTTLAVLPSMKARGSGRIINISSLGGKLAVPHMLPYSASKFALTGFSEGLHAELKKYGIMVTNVCPGLMRTGSARRAMVKGRHGSEYAWFSTSAALPLITMSAERAAKRIIRGIQRGEAEILVGLPAKAAAAFHALSTPTTVDFLAVIEEHVLPEPGQLPSGAERREGRELREAEPPLLDEQIERPAQRNLEVP